MVIVLSKSFLDYQKINAVLMIALLYSRDESTFGGGELYEGTITILW